jgi:calcium-dependent protein kinase
MGCCGSKSKKPYNVAEKFSYAKQNIRMFYSFGKVLGTGSFGTVKEGFLLTQVEISKPESERKKFAIKQISKINGKLYNITIL